MICAILIALISSVPFTVHCALPSQPATQIKTLSITSVDVIVEAFKQYREPPGLKEFATAVGDLALLQKAPVTNRRNYVRLYLYGLKDTFYDSVRQVYRVCRDGCGGQGISMFEQTVGSLFDYRLATLAHILPLVSDYVQSEEEGLVTILRRITAVKMPDWQRCGVFSSEDDEGAQSIYIQGKKYRLAIFRLELLKASEEERRKLIEKVVPWFGPHELAEIASFLKQHFGEQYSVASTNEQVHHEEQEIKTCSTFHDVSHEVFTIHGLRELILSRLDWKTLLYSIRYVNKELCQIVSRKFMITHCQDLKHQLHSDTTEADPQTIFDCKHPWSFLFKSVDALVKFYVDNTYNRHEEDEAPKSWLLKIIDGLRLYDCNDEALLIKCLKAHQENSHRHFDITIRSMTCLANVIMKPAEHKFQPMLLPKEMVVPLIGTMEDGEGLLHSLLGNGEERLFVRDADVVLTAILAADQLDWPPKLLSFAESQISDRLGFKITLPFTADEIRKLDKDQIATMLDDFMNADLLIKIMVALSEADTDVWDAFEPSHMDTLFDALLYKSPSLLTEQQFRTIMSKVIERLANDREFKIYLGSFLSCLLDQDICGLEINSASASNDQDM